MADKEQLAKNQMIVLQQQNGEKIYLDLNVSTDTTAIKSFEKSADMSIASFDYATVIAVFLALCATGLAYWFGARSFKLTEMSFKVVSEDIKEAAETHRITTVELLSSQERLKWLEIREGRYKEVINELCAVENFMAEIYQISQLNFIKGNLPISEYDSIAQLEKLTKMRKAFTRISHLFEIYFNQDIKQSIMSIIKHIDELIFDIKQNKENSYLLCKKLDKKISILIDEIHIHLKK